MGSKQTYRIDGRVIDDKTGRGIAGLRVEAWDKDLVHNDLVGSDETDAEGGFHIGFTRSYFRELFIDREPDLFFKVFDGDELLASTEDSVRWNAGDGQTPVELVVRRPDGGGRGERPVRGDGYVVRGAVVSVSRGGVGGLRVEVVDKNVGQDVSLDETLTDEEGRYELDLSEALRGSRKEKPDLQARAYAGETFLAASEVRYNAAPRETLNVLLPADAAGLPSEYETLTGALAAHYDGRLSELEESGERRDITYLANKSGWDARAVALAALAEQFSRQSESADGVSRIDPALYYALFRAGLPANPDVLYKADPALVKGVWERAAERGVIPEEARRQIESASETFRRLAAENLLNTPALAGASSWRELLNGTQLDAPQHEQFAQLYTEHRNDLPAFWQAVGERFGDETAAQLQLNGKLAFLTVNNAPLVQQLQQAVGGGGLSDPAQLASQGFHRPERWRQLLDDQSPVPQGIPGDTPEKRLDNYADYLAAQIRLSYPTAAVAEMVGSGELALEAPAQVQAFLTANQGKFELGVQPVEQYIALNKVADVDAQAVGQIKRLQRVYQLTPNDRAMSGMLKRGVSAAYEVVRYEKEDFVRSFADDLGGAEVAARTYEKSLQVHNAVVNIAVSYLTARNGIALGSLPLEARQAGVADGLFVRPAPQLPQATADAAAGAAPHAGDVLAYGTLESILGEMDYCACDHCRSLLSPAAYLVDLLFFIDRAPEPGATGEENPQRVLFQRRPDIEHLPLTCENTNTALPYIDIVNETLEYFVANSAQAFSLTDYVGHDTGSATTEDLLASPQSFGDGVREAAYAGLLAAKFPPPLPFHQPLENLRRYFDKFEQPLPLAMERLRAGDALDVDRTTTPAPPLTDYAWRDILIEELRLSRAEYQLLTDGALTLRQLYGLPAAVTTEDAAVVALSRAKDFARRLRLSYEDLAALLKTQFVNPNSALLPKIERLGVTFAALKGLKEGTLSDAEFDALLPTGAAAPDPAQYGGDIKAWVKNQSNYDRIMAVITLADPTDGGDDCSFDAVEFRYSKPATGPTDTSTRLGAVEFVRLLRFIRLWKKLGWTIEQTDAAVCALFPVPLYPAAAGALDTVAKLDAGFKLLLPRLGVVMRVMRSLNLTPRRDLPPLLACFSPLGTHGDGALYRQMFLNPAMLRQDATFADNGYGEFLTASPAEKLFAHADALRSAFNLTQEEFDRVADALGFDATTSLTLENISAVYRRGWLARRLKISLRELLLLMQTTGLDPFAAPSLTGPAILRLISLVQSLRERSLPSAAALYMVWHQDLSGKSGPTPAQVAAVARTLRVDFAAIDTEFAVSDDPDGSIAQTRMTLVYGAPASAFFFGLLGDTFSVEVNFADAAGTLASDPVRLAVEAASGSTEAGRPKLAYDDFRKRLTYTGLLKSATRDAIKAAAPDATAAPFRTAVDNLYAKNQEAVAPFFARYPELQAHYDAYVASAAPPAAKRAALLGQILPQLVKRRKEQQALLDVSAAAQTDLDFARALLTTSAGGNALHATGQPNRPALDDLLALETRGLSASFFAGDTISAPPLAAPPVAASLDYAPAGANPLPANPTAGGSVSGVWFGYVEAPANGFFNLHVEADAGATVTLRVDDRDAGMALAGTVWRNSVQLELQAGALHRFELRVEKVRQVVRVQWDWQPNGQGRVAVEPRYLYPAPAFESFRRLYLRFLKASRLAASLKLTANETAHFATRAEYRINDLGQLNAAGTGWLNRLPVEDNLHLPNPAAAAVARSLNAALYEALRDLLDYSRIKSEVSPSDESLLDVLRNPAAAVADAESLLFTLARWDKLSLDDLLARFGGDTAGLARFDLFRRVHEVFALLRAVGASGKALLAATTNEPSAATVSDFQAALRSRYDAADWRTVVQPINDAMRGLQRDALVAYILHGMRSDPATAHLDTTEKLFEYFLMDVQMEPCMQTSRIRHALSSVQLFTERCLMNLETRVSPKSINAERWQWMKRYRVWEANRKVFLYPENWLEPELRDDKSPFFKEIESELLQSDITEESAGAAVVNYLSKLEDVAKLEPCAIHHTPAVPAQNKGERNHVIARTAGAKRKYYYRRLEGGSWTPWEQVKLDIEDNPVLPVVWNGRLLLFWLRVLKKTETDPDNLSAPPSPSPTGPVANLSIETVRADAKGFAQNNARVKIQAVLCWSEFYQGKWQPTKTSDINKPATLGDVATNPFDRSVLRLWSQETTEGLRVTVTGGGSTTFLLHNTHSVPTVVNDVILSMFGRGRSLNTENAPFTIVYTERPLGGPLVTTLERPVLKKTFSPRAVVPRHPLDDVWVAPFFLEDRRHVFYVTTMEELVTVGDFLGFGYMLDQGYNYVDEIPPIYVAHDPAFKLGPHIWGGGGPGDPGPLVTNPAIKTQGITEPGEVKEFVTVDAYIDKGLAIAGNVNYGGQEIGPAGGLLSGLDKGSFKP